jgi:hypothetical protein
MSLRLLVLFVFVPIYFFSQKGYQIESFKANEKIVVDGKLSEQCWQKAEYVSNFTQLKPIPGKASKKQTRVSMVHSEDAIYFAAICYDHGDSISRVLSLRDDLNANLDVFGIFLDTYNDDQNGFYFGITSRGVQMDAKIISNDYNDLLNLVWRSAVTITDTAWIAEIEIPFSALRFPKVEQQDWGINFARQISRFREESTWHPVNPDLENYILESGSVLGLPKLEPPLRLALMPYLSGYLNHSKESGFSRSYNGGMDIKYGVNEALTLDVTLIPDFGQVVFDQEILNLSPFEVQFNENRQFFTEGTELFNKAGLFYSRRIGVQAPSAVTFAQVQNGDSLADVPQQPRLLNASKLSGRLKNGLGIGVFNAVTAEQQANAYNENLGGWRKITVAPLTNYNVLVLDQNLKNNSSITFTNTNVWRAGNFYDANVSGLNFKLNSKSNEYFVSGRGTLSARLLTQANLGHNWGLTAGDQRGAWIYSASYLEESHTYNPNDLGFNTNNNKRNLVLSGSYRNFRPKWDLMNRIVVTSSLTYSRLYQPNVFVGLYPTAGLTMVSKNFDAAGLRYNGSAVESFDYFEPRVMGRYFVRPTWHTVGGWISSNYQKPFAWDAGVNYIFVGRENWWEWNYYSSARFRLSDKIFLIHGWDQSYQFNSQGYAVRFGNPINTPQDAIIFGNRNRINTTQSVSLDYTLTNTMGITFRLRHYRSDIGYNSFYELLDNGRLSAIEFTGTDINGESAYDVSFNAFTIDMLYRWVFLPGSEVNIVWKNSIFTRDNNVWERYWSNLFNTLENGPTNSISMKVIYWLDAQRFRSKLKNEI